MTLYVNGEEKKISLRPWQGSEWGCDCFNDLETSVSDGQEVTPEEYRNIVDYWEAEMETFNSGGWSEQFGEQEESTVKEYGFWHETA